jgi:hypothetical protein
MPFLKIILATLLLQCTHVAFATEARQPQTAVDPQKAIVIRQLLEVTGAANIGEQFMSRMIEAQKKAHPEVDAVVWNRLAAKLDMSEMQGFVVDIYARHFSLEDLRASLAFYKSEPGQRMIKELPSAMKEAMTIGQQWGEQKAAELRQELLDEQAHKPKLG